ncbi:tetratricopeptide repeat protein [Ramlibacter tataouinensis]|uniref:YfgM family protein n=1 Tax=Ramlibacter tataouinensis TaxID=94132 RepID=UPI0022F3E0A4|nr:tetratricopeptide repeat protein [Ramlibacter tataouinensis]WBY01871.1 tetratricopeptide repeat protein [Ramlibacter tataouinensis]
MASHLDLEEQEQLDQLKHFWKTYGNLISWLLIAVFGSIAAMNGWQWYQRTQSAKASAIYEEVERAVQSGDLARAEQGFADAKDKYGGTVFAQQAGLLVAQAATDAGKAGEARAALAWVADKASDEGLQAIARLRLAALLVQDKAYDEALKQLEAGLPAEFAPLAADRRGDIYSLQGKKAEARAEYEKAWKGLQAETDYRRLVEVKLTALGVDPKSLAGQKAGGAKS